MSNFHNDDGERLAEMFRALGNRNRLRMFIRLVECCPTVDQAPADLGPGDGCRCVGELGRQLGICASTVSHHLKELRTAGLIQMQRDGQRVRCRLAPESLALLSAFGDAAGKRVADSGR